MSKYRPESPRQPRRLVNKVLEKMGLDRHEFRGMTPEMRSVVWDVGLQELKEERTENAVPYSAAPRKVDQVASVDTGNQNDLDDDMLVTQHPLTINMMVNMSDEFARAGDQQQSLHWRRKAAEAGSVYCQRELGEYYDYDLEGVARDLSEAAKWYEMAARHGDCSSQYHLGNILIAEGALQDFGKAAFWFEQAIKNIQICIVDGIEIEHDRTDRAYSNYELAILYLHGRGVTQDLDRCVQLIQEAAHLGCGQAAIKLGMMHYDGMFGVPDFAKAAYWFRLGADNGSWIAQRNLALCYWNGEGVEQNDSLAFEWIERSAEHWADYSDAQFLLGLFHEEGIGTKKDIAEAVKWYYKAAIHSRYFRTDTDVHRDAIQKLHDLIEAIPKSKP